MTDNFIVSARKYRPKGFEEVVGQEHITTTLTNAIKTKHIGQAMLFCGPRGVGKTTCARIFARLINEFDAQGSIYEASHLNIYELDAASNNSVDDVRSLIEQVRYPPQKGKYKVYIIDEVHMLSNQAFNAFLKTLEEPPSYAIFILATTEKHKVIPTILSRCQIYDFKRIEIQDIVKQLQTVAEKENIKTEEEALHLIASKADGALRDALSLFDLIVTFSLDNSITYKNTVKNLHIIDYEYYFKITDSYNNQNINDILLLYDEILKYGFEGQNFILGLMQHFRNLFICKHPETISLLNTSETIKLQYKTQAQETGSIFLFSAMDILSQADIYYKTSKNQRLHVELSLIKIYRLLTEHQQKITSPEEEVKKKTTLSDTTTQIKNIATKAPESSHNAYKKETPSIQINKPKTLEQTAQINNEPEQKNNLSMEDAWKNFKTLYEDTINKSELLKNIFQQTPSLKHENELEILIQSELQKSFFSNIEPELLQYLQNNLSTPNVKIIIKLNEKNTIAKPFTNKEKFEYLSKKNSYLLEMKEKLHLDIIS